MQTADEQFSKLIRSRGRCELCGSTDRIQCAHLISRRYRALRWNEDNAWCLCLAEHKRFTENPLLWDALVEERLGAERWAEMKRIALAGGGESAKDAAKRLRGIVL